MLERYCKFMVNDDWDAMETIALRKCEPHEASEWCDKWNNYSDKRVFFEEITKEEYLRIVEAQTDDFIPL